MRLRMRGADIRIPGREYNRIFIVEDRNHWSTCSMNYNRETDLVLVMDLGLLKLIESENGSAHFIDYLLERNYVEKLNYELHDFLHRWYLDKEGNDIFIFEGIPVGSAFLLNIINDISYNFHFFINLRALRHFQFKELICAVDDKVVKQWVERLYPTTLFVDEASKNEEAAVYFFPISKWMRKKVQADSFATKIRRWGVGVIEYLQTTRDFFFRNRQPAIYIQNYYPTNSIIDHFKKRTDVKLILANYTSMKSAMGERRIFYNNTKVKNGAIKASLKKFETMERYELIIDDFDIAAVLYELIATSLPELLKTAYSRLESIISYFKDTDLRLMVPVTELWLENKLIINYCQQNNITVFLIINGILGNNYAYDAKELDWVNCYGEAIKADYFGGRKNVICLGDPRMDFYSSQKQKSINRESPVILIGAGGYNMHDMNSYLAYEFDFLFDLLEVLDGLKQDGYKHRIILKVRENGYVNQYNDFLSEYFPQLNVTVEREVPFKTVIQGADFYISFYSQTLLEAAIIGIPSLYYKKDQHIINRPFNGQSEIVTAFNKEELKRELQAFYAGDCRYDTILQKEVLEQYIGKLDGKNLQRNIDFINLFLQRKKTQEVTVP